jgi:hypothetical protein
MRLSRLILVWLSLLAVTNAAQGIVFCAGAHGHVAIESAGHSHCPGAEHHHVHTPSYGTDHPPDSCHDHCEPCVDVPLVFGPIENSSVSAGDWAGGALLLIHRHESDGSSGQIVVDRDSSLLSQTLPLRTIILQV